MKKQFYIFMSFLFLTASLPASAKVYKWLDESGKVHYTNSPRKGATEVKLPPSTTYTPANAKNKNADKDKKANTKEKAAETETASSDDYNTIEIVEPKEGMVIRNDAGEVKIVIKLVPTLDEGHTRHIILDNAVPPKIVLPTNSATLSGIARGKHQFVLEIRNAKGRVVGKTKPRKFSLRKAAPKSLQ